jgi:Flp pilus assembly protein TadG
MTRVSDHIARSLWRFPKEERGTALVEFAIALPLVLLISAVIIEGGRLFWSYQSTIAGVRDAARYVARVAPTDSCSTGASFAGYTAKVEEIVRDTASKVSLLPSGITVTSVSPVLVCVAGGFRVSPAPVVQITATLEVNFPFSGVFTFAGGGLAAITTTITDQSRVFGT